MSPRSDTRDPIPQVERRAVAIAAVGDMIADSPIDDRQLATARYIGSLHTNATSIDSAKREEVHVREMPVPSEQREPR